MHTDRICSLNGPNGAKMWPSEHAFSIKIKVKLYGILFYEAMLSIRHDPMDMRHHFSCGTFFTFVIYISSTISLFVLTILFPPLIFFFCVCWTFKLQKCGDFCDYSFLLFGCFVKGWVGWVGMAYPYLFVRNENRYFNRKMCPFVIPALNI